MGSDSHFGIVARYRSETSRISVDQGQALINLVESLTNIDYARLAPDAPAMPFGTARLRQLIDPVERVVQAKLDLFDHLRRTVKIEVAYGHLQAQQIGRELPIVPDISTVGDLD